MMSPLAPVSLNRSKSGPELKYDPALAKSMAKKLMGEHYTEENLSKWNNSEITLFRLVLVLVYLMILNFTSSSLQIAGGNFPLQLVCHIPGGHDQDLQTGEISRV